MRMRKKKNLVPRMEACGAWLVRDPFAQKGRWRELMPGAREVRLELGCGKGRFTAGTAAAEPDVLLIAVEKVPDAMVVAMEKARDMGLRNVFFIDMDVAEIENIFAPGEIDRLFINFPDPWPRKKNAKRRLTHRGFLDKYCRVVREGGEFHFKTDNAPLFAYSLEEFAACRVNGAHHLSAGVKRNFAYSGSGSYKVGLFKTKRVRIVDKCNFVRLACAFAVFNLCICAKSHGGGKL